MRLGLVSMRQHLVGEDEGARSTVSASSNGKKGLA
jgi:hypothetical protein